MKKRLIIIFTLVIGFGIGWWFNEMSRFAKGIIADAKKPEFHTFDSISVINKLDSIIANKNPNVEKEDFKEFFNRFMIDPDFQLSRIIFPQEYIHFKDGIAGDEMDTTFIAKENWEHNFFYLTKTEVPIIYDNFEMKEENTDERLFVWSGIENGIYVSSFFKRISGKWYLIKQEDLST